MKNVSGSRVEQFLSDMKAVSTRKWVLILIVFLVMIMGLGLSARYISGADEPRIAGIAAEMVFTGNWLLPHLNGEPFLETPPLFFWSIGAMIKVFGNTDLAAKIPAALSGIAGALAVSMVLRRMRYSWFIAVTGAVMLATSLPYWGNARKCMTDIMLAAFIALAMFAFYSLTRSENLRSRLGWMLFYAAALGGALMSKALVGLAIPCSALFCWLLLDNLWCRRKFTGQYWAMLFGGAVLSLLPVGLWLLTVYLKYGYDPVYTIVWTNNIGRFVGSHTEHIEPFYYYLEVIPLQFQPWAVLAWAGVVYHVYNAWKKRGEGSNSIFMLCWYVIPYLILFMASGKRNVYVLPLYAGEALLAASFLHAVLSWKFIRRAFDWKWSSMILICLGWGAIITVPVLIIIGLCLGVDHFHFYYIWAPLCLAVAAVLWMNTKSPLRFVGLLSALTGIFVAADTYITPRNDAEDSFHDVFKAAAFYMAANGTDQIYLTSNTERVSGAAMFYLGRRVPFISEEELAVLVAEKIPAFVVGEKIMPGLDSLGVENERIQLYCLKNAEYKYEKDMNPQRKL